ncbi:MAG: 23S rRNA (adenine(2030)-N(6))-methyltransferase RlmJ [Opitutaceae bacterium]|nr:23S rRNA (adenine(2030)-N(6))-methyltransferase RlmJ [Opitutaceae bacterium]
MNYRHHFHAGNFADVMKHALLTGLVRAMQAKEKGALLLDTHAGRGAYHLGGAAMGDTLARRPEWPEGIGRLWPHAPEALPPRVAELLALVRRHDRDAGGGGGSPRHYPGSPVLLRELARPVDRVAACELHPAECEALRIALGRGRRVEVREADGYGALRAFLPPPERRALVLIDPPFEAADEFARAAAALGEALRRFPGGVYALWYPLTGRARVDDFFTAVRALNPPPAVACELAIAGEGSALKMKGCGLLVLNPPWRWAEEAGAVLAFLAAALAQEPGGGSRLEWIVPER